jgi:replicative DNA helicase
MTRAVPWYDAPPRADDAERFLAALVVIAPRIIPAVAAVVAPGDFWLGPARALFAAALAVHRSGGRADDVAALLPELQKEAGRLPLGAPPRSAFIAAVGELLAAEHLPHWRNATWYARRVARAAAARRAWYGHLAALRRLASGEWDDPRPTGPGAHRGVPTKTFISRRL